ncbi:gliding motility-associated-like protein [Flavobacterium sp. 1]|uniref:PKD domain-containing protein n=1 Tax=Flavobacterium sp. 1 TaxID=2035200 RepID=UPI000C247D59|nr:PKD domain-containing protein [Flavobacterium sp. 1]PJJ07284.1 gliding motility-associated-like protein [Flavobacterium sp. 1]
MNLWLKNYFVFFFLFLFMTIQAKSYGSFLALDKEWNKFSFELLNGSGIIGDTIKNGISTQKENDTVKSLVSKNVKIALADPPDASLDGTGSGTTYEGIPVFRNCLNPASAIFNFIQNSTTAATNASYTIHWGDGSPDFTIAAPWNAIESHTYQRGSYTLVFTVVGTNGESRSKNYTVFVGTGPTLQLSNPSGNAICKNNDLAFRIFGIAGNSASTIYKVSFNDVVPPSVQTYSQPAAGVDFIDVTHTFANTSCGTNSQVGNVTYSDAFYASVEGSNPCGVASNLLAPLYVSTAPTPNFSISDPAISPSLVPIGCIDKTVRFTNTSFGGSLASSQGCNTNSKFIWTVSTANYRIIAGSLGNDRGTIDTDLWISGTKLLDLQFTVPGTYTITLKIGNTCGTSEITNTICIESPLVPTFSLNTNSVCTTAPGNGDIIVNDTTDESKSCNPPTYNWSVTYLASNCGTGSNWSFTNGTNSSSKNPSFKFLNPGTYTLKLNAANASCGTFSTSQVIEVKQPPIVTINGPASKCGGYNAASPALPTAIVQNCRPDSSTLAYSWNFPGGSPASSSSLNPGPIVYPPSTTIPVEYSIDLMVTNDCGSTTAITYKFTIKPVPHVANSVLEQTICSGSTSTPVVLTSDYVRTPPDIYSWTATATAGVTGFIASGTGDIPAQTISTANANSGSVTYVITPLSFGCPGPVTNYVIKVDPLPYFTTQPADNSLCQGGVTNPLAVAVNVTPTAYQWYSNTADNTTTGIAISGANSSTFTPPNTLGINYYYCIVTFTAGACTSITSRAGKVEVVVLPAIDVQPLSTQNLCIGGITPTPLKVHYIDGSGTATYQWYTNSTNSNSGGTPIANATTDSLYASAQAVPGTYYNYVVITIAGNGCGTLISNTAAIVTVSDPVFTSVIPLPDQDACQSIAPISNAFPWSVTVSGGLDINGGTTGTFEYNYQWYLNNSSSPVNGANSASFTPPTDQIGISAYSVEVTQSNNRGCNIITPFTQVKVYPQAVITANPASENICFGGVFSPLNVSYTGSFGTPQYQWFSNMTASNTGGTAISGANASSYTPTDVTTAVKYYYCQISFLSGGCNTISSNFATLNVSQQTTITTQPTPSQTLCIGGTATLIVVPGNGAGTPTYQWFSNTANSNSGGTAILNANSESYTSPLFTTVGSFYYYVTIQYSGNGCTLVTGTVAEIIAVPDPTITAQPIASQIICKDALPLKVVVSGGAGSYLYQWYSNAVNSNAGGILIEGAASDTFIPPNESPAEFSPITRYFYCEITQSGVGCGVTSNTAQVTTYPLPKIDAHPLSSAICLGQSTPDLFVTSHDGVRFTGSPAYQWYSNITNTNSGGTPITGANNSTYTPPVGVIRTNYYYCIISFLGGCGDLISNVCTVAVNPVPVIASKTVSTCDGVVFLAEPNNPIIAGDTVPLGTLYTWSNPVISPAGTITGGSAQVTPQPNISQTLVNTSVNAATATYTVTPVSGASCVGANFTVVVTVKPSMYANEVIMNSKCFNAHNGSIVTNITGGIPFGGATPYILSWTGPNAFSSSAAAISSLAPGVYHLNIKDNSGCKNFDKDYTVTEPEDMLISTVKEKDVTCFGYGDGAIDISITGGTAPYVYVWEKDGVSYSVTTEDLTGLTAGNYVVSVVDSNGCTPVNNPKIASFTITQPPVMLVSLVSQVNVKCYGDATGEIVVSATGGTPIPVANYSYAWTGPNGFTSTSQNLTGLFAGTYNLVVTDQLGCQVLLQVSIVQNNEIIITPTVSAISCAGNNNGSISVAVRGGVPPYQYVWSDFGSGSIRDNLAPGNYTFTVTDALLCAKEKMISVPAPPPFNINPVVSNISCFGIHDGSIVLNINGGVSPVKVLWDDNPTAGSSRFNLAAGTYSVTISDGQPCSITASFVIIEPQPLALTANLTNAFDCTNANSGAINLLVSGGTPPFAYVWSNGVTTEDLANIPAGNYLVTVTDARGCKKQSEYVIYRQPPIVIAVDTKTNYNCDTHLVAQTFVAKVSGGLPPYQLTWSSGVVSGANNEIMNTSQNGVVTLTAIDGLGCQAHYTFEVKIPELGYPDFTTSSYAYSTYGFYSVVDPIQFKNTSNGDFISIAWDFGDGSVSNEINPTHSYLTPGQFTVLQSVAYSLGCVYTYSQTLNIEKGYELISPTGFTPNGDGINDFFTPQFLGMKSIKFEVYNTWGVLIYSEEGETIRGWNGYVKDRFSENGNYFYRIVAITFYGTEIKQEGSFTLIK